MAEAQSLPKELFRFLLRQYFKTMQREFRRDYEANIANPEFDLEGQLLALKEVEDELRHRTGAGDLPAWTKGQAEQLLEEHEINFTTVPEGQIARLAEGIARARIENFRSLRARYRGDYGALGSGPIDLH